MYGECWFTGKFYFKHGGSQNATLKTCAITWRQQPAGTSRCSTDHAVRFAREYAVTYVGYDVNFNNCKHVMTGDVGVLDCVPAPGAPGRSALVRHALWLGRHALCPARFCRHPRSIALSLSAPQTRAASSSACVASVTQPP